MGWVFNKYFGHRMNCIGHPIDDVEFRIKHFGIRMKYLELRLELFY